MTADQVARAELARERALTISVLVRDEDADSVTNWIAELTDAERLDLIIVLAAAMPTTMAGLRAAWAWTDGLAPDVAA